MFPAQRGQTLCIGDAQHCEFAEDIEGSADIDESILAVPLRYERRTIGVIVLSKLGLDQFSTLSVRLLELLAAQAAVAFENARLLEAERRSVAIAKALLGIATMAAADPSVPAVASQSFSPTNAPTPLPSNSTGARFLTLRFTTGSSAWALRSCHLRPM